MNEAGGNISPETIIANKISNNITGPYLEDALYNSDNTIPHPPYNPKDGKFHADQFNPYVAAHVTTNYRGGLVIIRDEDLVTSEKMRTVVLGGDFPEVTKYAATPVRTAVCIAEMRNGTGDIYEGVSLALDMARRGNTTTLVMPRDKVTYKKTQVVLQSLNAEITACSLIVKDYHQAFEESPFDLAIYPSTARYLGTVPSKTTLLLRESGETIRTRAGISWESDQWGGVTAYINTGFNTNVDKYGAVAPIKAELEPAQMQPQERELLQQIKDAKRNGQEIVLAYPGSNEETEASNFIQFYEQLLKRDWGKEGKGITVLIPGETKLDTTGFSKDRAKFKLLDTARKTLMQFLRFSNDQIKIRKLGGVRNAFLQYLMKEEISKEIPSLVAGSMTVVEAMKHGIPFFYKIEYWKSGNAKALAETMKQSGLEPKEVEVAISSGVFKEVDNNEGCQVKILYFEKPKDEIAVEAFSNRLQQTAQRSFGKLSEAIFGWYGMLKMIYDQEDPKLLQHRLADKTNEQGKATITAQDLFTTK